MDTVQETVEAVHAVLQGESEEEHEKDEKLVASLNYGFLISGVALISTFAMAVGYLLLRLKAAQRKAKEDRNSFIRFHVPLLMVTGAALWVLFFKNPLASEGVDGVMSKVSKVTHNYMGTIGNPKDSHDVLEAILPSQTFEQDHNSVSRSGTPKKKFWAGFLIGALAALSIYNQATDDSKAF